MEQFYFNIATPIFSDGIVREEISTTVLLNYSAVSLLLL
jgi:hypothetical protein